MKNKIQALICILVFIGGCSIDTQNQTLSSADSVKTVSQYTLPNTEVRRLKSESNGVDYVLYISVPAEYHETSAHYPVLYLLDADYSFAIAHNVVEHFIQRDNISGLILVGIAYEGKSQNQSTYRKNRVRDYTPSHVESGVYSDEISAYSGGGNEFITFIQSELIPYMEANYRVSDDRGIVGHSLGGYFATYMLINQPETFNKYIILSPSLWYDEGMIFKSGFTALTGNKTRDMQAFFAVGEHENQPWRGWPMVDDMRKIVTKLDSLNIQGPEINSQVFENEIHNSIFPVAFTRGIRTLYR